MDKDIDQIQIIKEMEFFFLILAGYILIYSIIVESRGFFLIGISFIIVMLVFTYLRLYLTYHLDRNNEKVS